MGLFDDRIKSGPEFDAQKAVMTIIVAAIMRGGNVSDAEVRRLRSMCARSPIFSRNSKEEEDIVVDFAVSMNVRFGADAARKAAEVLKQELKETAFAFAAELILADGIVGDKEEAFLNQLAKILGISDELGRAVIHITSMRSRIA